MSDADHPSTRGGPAEGATWLGGLAALLTLTVVTVVWIAYPPAGGAEPEVGADRALTGTGGGTDLAGFRSDVWYLPDDNLGFVEIPAGSFLMGSDPALDDLAYDNERWSPTQAQGTVDLPLFWIARYEVTVAQFRAFVAATGRGVDSEALRGRPDHPVVAVSWTDALAYSRWLEGVLREFPRSPVWLTELLSDGWRITLPTEAEWEKAARGTDGRIYPWGNEPEANRVDFGDVGTHPVGASDCSTCAFGLSDMSGNVWELTRSPYRPYPYDPTHRGDLGADALWVMRGGSFGDPVRNVRAAARGGVDPGARRPFLGFRLVVTRF